MTQKGDILTADAGKIFRRIDNGDIYGPSIRLGWTFIVNGEYLENPHKDTSADFEEIDEPEDIHDEYVSDYVEPEDTSVDSSIEDSSVEQVVVDSSEGEYPQDELF